MKITHRVDGTVVVEASTTETLTAEQWQARVKANEKV